VNFEDAHRLRTQYEEPSEVLVDTSFEPNVSKFHRLFQAESFTLIQHRLRLPDVRRATIATAHERFHLIELGQRIGFMVLPALKCTGKRRHRSSKCNVSTKSLQISEGSVTLAELAGHCSKHFPASPVHQTYSTRS